ncbi:hypothetical protein [methane-oxidizing endosymbiont of Gigantopelta aegis]|uniref:hypothetical protein n=1 Tax=methane-oxidizing endosymbiont of Gigantopelta aegis TaxID=2794938 RepID=UPI0018DBE7A6|nr:hypothetical protein [methane-oxidizing endosymbiont of Gigantopelta aegis]
MTNEALISPQVLRWACERARVSDTMLAEKVSKKAPLWLRGEAKPTFYRRKNLPEYCTFRLATCF